MIKKEKNRGILLTVWLYFVIGMHLIVISIYSLSHRTIIPMNLTISAWENYVFLILGLLNLLFYILLFMWKKWAFFAYCGSASIIFVIGLAINEDIISSILGLCGPVILYLFMRPKWHLFE